MPWKTVSLLKLRQRLIEAMLARKRNVQDICVRSGVSRKTAYKWFQRFRERGMGGLGDRSRRPQRWPDRLQVRWLKDMEHLRRKYPHWGAKKIRQQLRRQHPRQHLPCARTIHRWLRSGDWLHPRPKRARHGPSVPHPGLTAARWSNHVWTLDFKGWFCTDDGMRQEPLVVRDLFSRYGLCLRLLPNQEDQAVRAVLSRLFAARGLPKVIRVDNGSPFAGTGALGLSRLSVWWLRLGIRVEFTRRARPGDNAAHEQFNGCYQREVVAEGAPQRQSMQGRSIRWLKHYNYQRPHEALGGRTPAQVYRNSRRTHPKELPPLIYLSAWEVRRVRNHGHIKWLGRLRFVGRAFVGQLIGLKPLAPDVHAAYLGKLLIGELHQKDASGMRPAHWSRHQDQLKV